MATDQRRNPPDPLRRHGRKTRSPLASGIAFLLVLAVVACGDEPAAPEETAVSVCEAVEGEAPDGKLTLSGKLVPLNKLGAAASPGSLTGFVLTAKGCSVFVDTGDRSRVAGLRGKVTVRGQVAARSKLEAERLRAILDLPSGADRISEQVPSPVTIGPGSRFIDAYSVSVLPAD